MNISWKIEKSRYCTYNIARVGRWRVGTVVEDCELPGIKDFLGVFSSAAEGKEKLRHAVNHWFSKLEETQNEV